MIGYCSIASRLLPRSLRELTASCDGDRELCSYVVLWRINKFKILNKYVYFKKSIAYYSFMSLICQAIRKAIKADSRTRYRIFKDTDISEPMLCLFMQGKREMGIDRLELLADYLGLEITIRPKKGGKKHG